MKRRAVIAGLSTLGLAAAMTLSEHTVAAGDAGALAIEIGVIHALRTDGGGSIDPKLRDLPQLTKEQPFVRYNVFKLLERTQRPLQRGKPVSYELVDGRTLQVTLTDVADAADPNGASRYHVRAEIDGGDKKEFLKLLEVTASDNAPFFVGGLSYKGGTLFLELAVRP